jgi:hypothetical protein
MYFRNNSPFLLPSSFTLISLTFIVHDLYIIAKLSRYNGEELTRFIKGKSYTMPLGS